MSSNVKYYSLGCLSKKERAKVKKFLIHWITGAVDMVASEKVEEIFREHSDISFSGDDRISITLPFEMVGNDILAAIGFVKRKKKTNR